MKEDSLSRALRCRELLYCVQCTLMGVRSVCEECHTGALFVAISNLDTVRCEQLDFTGFEGF